MSIEEVPSSQKVIDNSIATIKRYMDLTNVPVYDALTDIQLTFRTEQARVRMLEEKLTNLEEELFEYKMETCGGRAINNMKKERKEKEKEDGKD